MPEPLPTPTVDPTFERGAVPAEGGRVDVLLRVAVPFPGAERERPPLALALVLDRSGSMSGAAIHHAREAAAAALGMLRDGDRVAVVAFDDRVDAVVPCTAVGDDRRALLDAVRSIETRGTTALHAGWAEGVRQVAAAPVADGMRRVVLLSDGHANRGTTDPAALAAEATRAAAAGVATSTVGLGRGVDERLLGTMADAGGGAFAFVEGPDQLDGLFETELAGLSALRGRRVRLAFHGDGARFVAAGAGARAESGALGLPDLVAGLPRTVLATVEVDAGAPLPPLRLEWDDVLAGAPAHLSVPLQVPALPADQLARRPVAEAVAGARRVAAFADGVAQVRALLDQGRLDAATEALEALRREVAAWPDDAERAARLEDLERMLATARTRDVTLAQKRVYAEARDLERNERAGAKRHHMLAERERMQAYRAAKEAAAADVSAHASLEYRVPRAGGGRAIVSVALGDLAAVAADVVVVPTDALLSGDGGVDRAVRRRGGPRLEAAARAIGRLGLGEARAVPGFELRAAHVAFVTTLPWQGGHAGELDALAAAYTAAFDTTRRMGAGSVALPAIGTGAFGLPAEAAARVAVGAALRAIAEDPTLGHVRFVLADVRQAEAYRRRLGEALAGVAA